MATIRQLKSGNWNARVRSQGQPTKTKTFKTKELAVEWSKQQETINEVIPKVSSSSPLESVSQPIESNHTIYELGLLYREQRLKTKSTYESVMSRLRILKQYFTMPAREITPQIVNNFKMLRLQKWRNDTVLADLNVLSRIFNFAIEEFLLNCENPVKRVKKPPQSKARNRVVTESELKRIMSVSTPLMADIFELAYETAMRRCEITSLKKCNLYLKDRLLQVIDGKQGDRFVPLTYRAIEILERVSAPLRHDEKLFNVRGDSVTQAFGRARTKVGISKDVVLHQLRHTRCTIVSKKGFNNAQIMAVTGHTDLRSVQRYTHLHARDVLDLIN